jgi:hypothetical protein
MQRHVSVIDTTPVNSEEFLKRAKVHARFALRSAGGLLLGWTSSVHPSSWRIPIMCPMSYVSDDRVVKKDYPLVDLAVSLACLHSPAYNLLVDAWPSNLPSTLRQHILATMLVLVGGVS